MRAQGRHYERAFEHYLRAHRVPYVAVDEARRALTPLGPSLSGAGKEGGEGDLKSFDFVIYRAGGPNLIVDIKGRRAGSAGRTSGLQSWVTEDDVRSLRQWERLFGVGPAGRFRGAFVFVYWCDEQPPDALFQEVFEHRGRWYALRAVGVADYAAAMRPRSARWRTVCLSARDFEGLSHPLSGSEFQEPGPAGSGVLCAPAAGHGE